MWLKSKSLILTMVGWLEKYVNFNLKAITAIIRAVAGQRSSPDLCFATTSVKIYDP